MELKYVLDLSRMVLLHSSWFYWEVMGSNPTRCWAFLNLYPPSNVSRKSYLVEVHLDWFSIYLKKWILSFAAWAQNKLKSRMDLPRKWWQRVVVAPDELLRRLPEEKLLRIGVHHVERCIQAHHAPEHFWKAFEEKFKGFWDITDFSIILLCIQLKLN